MFSIKIIQVGKTKEPEVQALEHEYQKRVRPFCALTTEGVASRVAGGVGAEAWAILNKLSPDEVVVLLDEKGKEYTSIEFADFIKSHRDRGDKLAFVIGGAYGVHSRVKERARHVVALSKMTFPHQLVRLIFLEQLYRAFTIAHGMKYHHE